VHWRPAAAARPAATAAAFECPGAVNDFVIAIGDRGKKNIYIYMYIACNFINSASVAAARSRARSVSRSIKSAERSRALRAP
jgi:hypothetical protein